MSKEEIIDLVVKGCEESNDYSIQSIATAIEMFISGSNANYYEVLEGVRNKLQEKYPNNPEKIEIEFKEPEERFEDRCDIVSTEEGEKVKPEQFHKFIAYYDIYIYSTEGQIIKLIDATCIFLAKCIEIAQGVAFYYISQNCLMEQLAVRSIVFKKIEEVIDK